MIALIETGKIAKHLDRRRAVCRNSGVLGIKLAEVPHLTATVANPRHPFPARALVYAFVTGCIVASTPAIDAIQLVRRFSQIGACIVRSIAAAVVDFIRPMAVFDQPDDPRAPIRVPANAYFALSRRGGGAGETAVYMLRHIGAPAPYQKSRLGIIAKDRSDEIGCQIVATFCGHRAYKSHMSWAGA